MPEEKTKEECMAERDADILQGFCGLAARKAVWIWKLKQVKDGKLPKWLVPRKAT